MAKVSILGSLTNFQILLFTLLRGKLVGKDSSGNKYYRGKPRRGITKERRWVIYPGRAESSTVPAEWHGWLHHQTDRVPEEGAGPYRKDWQKPHQPNMTGSDGAYLPPGHPLRGGARATTTSDYVAWQPPQ